jgi:hypothetical protein
VCDKIQGFELFPEVRFKRGSIVDVGAIFVLEVLQLRDKGIFKIEFGCDHRHRGDSLFLASAESVRLSGFKCERAPR